jgi:hypothetical protein
VRDFGGKMVADCKEELAKHLTTSDLDQIAQHIISIASDEFLDRCLEKRLLTIEAKPLINALARAERLGYEPNDVVEGDHERVLPGDTYGGSTKSSYPYTTTSPMSIEPTERRSSSLQCMSCFRVFQMQSAYDYVSGSLKKV